MFFKKKKLKRRKRENKGKKRKKSKRGKTPQSSQKGHWDINGAPVLAPFPLDLTAVAIHINGERGLGPFQACCFFF